MREYKHQLREAFFRNNCEQQAKPKIKKSSIKASIFDLTTNCRMQLSRYFRRYKDLSFYNGHAGL